MDIQPLRLTRDDLRGRSAISYLRFSSAPQESGSTIDRQQETLDRVVAHFGLRLDQALMDKALSASKGHNRTRGKLGDLLKSIEAGIIERGTVLCIEAMDRLSREKLLNVFDMLSDLMRTGLIIVTGDYTIYDEASINGDLSHKLVAEIQAAHNYTARLSQLAEGAHAKRRKALEIVCDNPDAPKPMFNSLPPGWIIRSENGYVLHPAHSKTVRRIFRMYLDGHSVRQIVARFNAEKVSLLPSGGKKQANEWRAPRIAAILRDEHVLGYVQPHIRDATNHSKRIAKGRKVKLYPAVIDADVWLRVRDLLNARRSKLVGRRGSVSNLFTGKVFCCTCGSPMRVDSGGRIKNGQRPKILVCARRVESNTCKDVTRYDMNYFERFILTDLAIMHSTLARQPKPDNKHLADELAKLTLDAQMLEQSIATLAPRIGVSAALAAQVEKMSMQLDEMRRIVERKRIELQAATAPTRRNVEAAQFIRQMIAPALKGDLAARERLRSLLAPIDFTVHGDGHGGLLLQYAERKHHILPL